MSVSSLGNTSINVYTVRNSKNSYGAHTESYRLRLADIRGRFNYRGGKETIINAREMNIPDYRLYIQDASYNVIENDLIVDQTTGIKYEIKNVYNLNKKHWQIDCLKIDKLSSNVEICPNNLQNLNGTLYTGDVIGSGTLTVNLLNNSSDNFYINFFDSVDSVDIDVDINNVMYGAVNVTPTLISHGFIPILVNNETRYIKVWTGETFGNCATILPNNVITTGNFGKVGNLSVVINNDQTSFIEIYQLL
jgi:hypothetical protein